MTDLPKFRAPYIPRNKIWEEADKFRDKYWSPGLLPVDIEQIVEFQLDLEIRTIVGLKRVCNTDALLLGNLETIIVDTEIYMNERMVNRIRYSLAHEIGHLVLHPNIYKQIAHSSIPEWIAFFQSIPDDQYTWIEQHAYEFAGRLLVPREELIKEFDRAVARAEAHGFTQWDSSGDTAREYIARGIAHNFAVSEQVVAKRLLREELFPHPVNDR
jgi:Zn-dependent peptidase ImmA (M78 family)